MNDTGRMILLLQTRREGDRRQAAELAGLPIAPDVSSVSGAKQAPTTPDRPRPSPDPGPSVIAPAPARGPGASCLRWGARQ
jgi:hypothetical protein